MTSKGKLESTVQRKHAQYITGSAALETTLLLNSTDHHAADQELLHQWIQQHQGHSANDHNRKL